MLRGLGRSPFAPRGPQPLGASAAVAEPPPPADNAAEMRRNRAVPSTPAPPPPPPPPRRSEAAKEVDPAQEQYEALKRLIHTRLVDRLDMNRIAEIDPKTLRNDIRGVVEQLCDTENPLLNRNERQRLVNEVLDETLGFGPLELLLKDDKIGDIMINGPKNVYVEKEGRIQKSDVGFRDNEHLLQIIDRIVSRVGRRVDETSPMVDARLPDGSRFNAIIPPLALDGPVVTIRMFGSKPLSKDDLLRFKAFTPEMLIAHGRRHESAAERHHLGGNRVGQDDALEHAFQLHSSRASCHHDRRRGRAAIAARSRRAPGNASLQHRGPGCRDGDRPGQERTANAARPDHHRRMPGAETLDMIQAMNTGHEGSMTTVHANTPRDALSRLETMISMAGLELPIRALRSQFASAVDLIIQASRLQGGPRKVTSISEVIGMEGDTIIMQEIFAFRPIGVDANGRAHGEFIATGIRPSFMDRLEQAGCHLPADLFTSACC